MLENDLQRQLLGWSLTTAEITYRMPDHRNLLQSYIWQEYDLAPRFPRLVKFLDFLDQKSGWPVGGDSCCSQKAYRTSRDADD